MSFLKKGIDVSEMQGRIDWQAVKNAGISYAVLRCGYGQDQVDQDDAQWDYNTSECERLEIPYGAYFFCYATTPERALGEAQHARRLLRGKKLSYPVYYDMEYSDFQGDLTPSQYAAIAKVFCDDLEQAGFFVGVYANLNWWENRLTDPVFNNWTKWVAQYYTHCEYTGSYGMWQYTNSGIVSGISGNVDMNECYVDYPALIAGTSSPAKPTEPVGPGSKEQRYTVQKGDTLSEIAERYQTNYKTLAAYNGIEDPDRIDVGQVIVIPAAGEAPLSYTLGDHVVFSSCYASSEDPIEKAIPASEMLRNHGVITKIISGARNPYLLDDGLCWVNAGDIRGHYAT
ncbi:MAG: GH25 family lysozyme [Acutalibacteraceae bacterium]